MIRQDQFRVRARVLTEASDAQETAGRLDLIDLSGTLGISIPDVREIVETLEALGLLISGLNEGEEPLVLRAGRQYLELRGEIDDATLAFLAGTIDDVHARAASLQAGTDLVRGFRHALLDGGAVPHARAEEIVAVRIVEGAREHLDRRQPHELDASAAAQADAELRLLIGLFHDDTVPELFERSEPPAGTDVEAWFGPFDKTAPAGYLGERA